MVKTAEKGTVPFSLVFASLRYYQRVHAMVIVGVAIAVAVLSGALIVGASVRASLRDLALARLGNTHTVVSSASFFRESLGTTPLIAMTAAVMHDDTGRTAARVQVFGINDAFLRFHGIAGSAPRGREAWISEGLARELNAQSGAPLIVRIAKPSDIPLTTLQGRREDAGERIRLSVARIADRQSLGEFSLVPAQGPALTLIVPLERLQRDLQLEGRVNALLVGEDGGDAAAVRDHLRKTAQLDDYGLAMRPSADQHTLVVDSRAGILSTPIVELIRDSANGAQAVLVHLANVIRIGEREIPYSLVAGRDGSPEGVWLNQWAADDLGAKVSDPVTLEYFVWSDEAGLQTRSTTLTVGGVVAMSAEGGDPTFTPQYPGLTDAEDVSGWDPPFPVDLTRVRQKDEDYWDTWRSSPKALVPLQVAQELWGTAHGNVSSVRVPVPAGLSLETFTDQLRRAIGQRLDPITGGFTIRPVRADALAAAAGTTDFGEYFVYFSFFLVVAGLLLASLFFALGVEQRYREIGVLSATGFRARDIRRLFVAEAAVLATVGSVLGVAGAIAYAAVIMHGLRTWWVDAVGTTALTLHLDWLLLVAGAIAALLAATAALAWSLRTALARTPRELLGGVEGRAFRPAFAGKGQPAGWPFVRALPITGIVMAIAALAMIAAARVEMVNPVAGFFGAGGALMIAGLATFGWWLRRVPAHVAGLESGATVPGVANFGAHYARWRPTRSVLSASLITFACFVIVSVGAFRRDPSGMSLDRSLGTGGFVLLAEAVAPLVHNPNLPSGRQELALAADARLDRMRVARFRLRPGDEASCLTLYQPRNPRIVAPEAAFLGERRFAFAQSLASSDAERDNPWLLLNRRFDDGAIPAIADHTTLTYVFHVKVGEDYIFAPDGASETRLRIVGALADSVLQSELVIGEPDFMRLFPRIEGYGLWMIEAPESDAPALATLLEERLSDLGVDVVDTRARLAAYHQVENTYLSTFQALGGLGLLVGTLGLAAVLARNVLERRRELGLLRAVGFTPGHLRTLVLSESLLLVGTGLVLGAATALVAVLPALSGRGTSLPVNGLALLLAAVAGTAVLASVLAARLATATSVVAALKSE